MSRLGSVWVAGLITGLLLTGCCGKRVSPSSSPLDGVPDIRIWGFASVDPRTQHEVWYNLGAAVPGGVPLDPYFTLPLARECLLHISQEVNGKQHEYCALVGPDWQTGAPAEVYVQSSVAEPYLIVGWILLMGSFPSADTEISHTSSDGTRIALRAERGESPRDYIYNLPTSPKYICVTVDGVAGEPIRVYPGHYLVVSRGQSEELDPREIRADDEFIAFVNARVRALNLDLGGCTGGEPPPGHRSR